MSLLRAALSVVGGTPPERPDRARLRAVIAARDAAQREVEARTAVVERLERLVEEGRSAADRATEDDAAAATAETTWGLAGCDPTQAGEHQRLRAIANESKRVADPALVAAQAAQKGMRPARSALEGAQSEVRGCEGGISREIADVIFEEQRLKVARLEAFLEELPEVFLDALAIEQFIDPWARGNEGLRSDQAHAQVAPVLQRCWSLLRSLCQTVDRYSGHPLFEGLDRRKRLLRERAAQLRQNPDA
jgi:hypothetical protein